MMLCSGVAGLSEDPIVQACSPYCSLLYTTSRKLAAPGRRERAQSQLYQRPVIIEWNTDCSSTKLVTKEKGFRVLLASFKEFIGQSDVYNLCIDIIRKGKFLREGGRCVFR